MISLNTQFEQNSKTQSVDAVISDSVRFKVPWLGNVDGIVEVGSTDEFVENVRVCAQLLKKRSKHYSCSHKKLSKQVKNRKISPRTCMCGTRIK